MLIFAALIQGATASGFEPAWPNERPGKVISTPNWSDYRIYPKDARDRGQEGRVVPELLVGADGRPTACRILESSRFPELDAGSCELMMQMRFEPGLDGAGKAIPSHFSRPLIWVLNDPRPFSSSRLSTEVKVANEHLNDCTVISGDGPYLAYWSGLSCYVYKDVHYFFGQRAAEDMSAVIDVRLNAGDGAPFLKAPLPSGDVIAAEKLAFTINKSGDASDCTVIQAYGFGSRDLNNLSPCGRLLSGLWFKDAPGGATPRKGIIETRVIVQKSEPQPH